MIDGLEILRIEDIEIPRYGSVTVGEHLFLEAYLGEQQGLFSAATNPISDLIVTAHFRLVLTTLLLVSRHSTKWSIEEVSLLDHDAIVAASEFLLNERKRWDDAPQKPQKQSGKPMNWEQLRLKLALSYPNEPLFSREQFPRCPLIWLEDYLHALTEKQHQDALPVALLGIHLLAAKGVKRPKLEWFSPAYGALARQEAQGYLDPDVARVLSELSQRGRVPLWVREQINWEQVALAVEK